MGKVENRRCTRCGMCCVSNGPIPPVEPGEDVPEWLGILVERLRLTVLADEEEMACIFYRDRPPHCTIHEVKPGVCREFLCLPLVEQVKNLQKWLEGAGAE